MDAGQQCRAVYFSVEMKADFAIGLRATGDEQWSLNRGRSHLEPAVESPMVVDLRIGAHRLLVERGDARPRVHRYDDRIPLPRQHGFAGSDAENAAGAVADNQCQLT